MAVCLGCGDLFVLCHGDGCSHHDSHLLPLQTVVKMKMFCDAEYLFSQTLPILNSQIK